jgi:hypothetical protein
MNYDAFQHDGFQPFGFQETAVSVSRGGGVGSGVYQRRDLPAYLAALNAAQLERRKEADAIYAMAYERNAAILRARVEAHRQREEEWLLGLITDAEYIAA